MTQVSSTHSRFSTAVLQKSASELSVVKQLGQRHQHHHHKELNQEPWLRVVPSYKVLPRNCDEVPDEFKRAGIGLCFRGKLETCSIFFPPNEHTLLDLKNSVIKMSWVSIYAVIIITE